MAGHALTFRFAEIGYCTDAHARQHGLKRYVPVVKVARPIEQPRKPAMAPPLKTPAPERRKEARRDPMDIPEAIRLGLSNDAIHALVKRGVITRPASLEHAAREFGNSGSLNEAMRRGLVW